MKKHLRRIGTIAFFHWAACMILVAWSFAVVQFPPDSPLHEIRAILEAVLFGKYSLMRFVFTNELDLEADRQNFFVLAVHSLIVSLPIYGLLWLAIPAFRRQSSPESAKQLTAAQWWGRTTLVLFFSYEFLLVLTRFIFSVALGRSFIGNITHAGMSLVGICWLWTGQKLAKWCVGLLTIGQGVLPLVMLWGDLELLFVCGSATSIIFGLIILFSPFVESFLSLRRHEFQQEATRM